jgi:hypothetical protein
MITMIRFGQGHADLRTRYVRTQRFQLERAARRALFGAHRNPFTGDPSVAGVDDGNANTSMVWHAGRLLALKEAALPYELDPVTLETRGVFSFDGQLPGRTFTAHPKIDPLTGEMIAFSYNASGRPDRYVNHVQRTVLIESDRPGVELPDDWDGFGQRLTGSGSIVLDRVAITGADYFERPVIDQDRPRYPFTFNQVHLTTVVAGIANRALLDAVELVRSRTRNYYHGTAGHVQDEPVIQAVIGVASAKAFAATATIGAAAALLEQSWDAPQDFGLSLEATLAASRAKITVESLALEVIDALTQVASGSTLSTERALDRHWRNLKVLASHNPSIYKHQILGAYELHGTQPPLGVYF